jgi:bifunctional UDP-N-acetylglucosamine pyrophosphorylase/glucosamine-1-phosphate N-acetyltransferase
MAEIGAVILAAGKGTRMHSDKPKVLQTLLDEPMLGYVAQALLPLFGSAVWAVIGHGAEQVRAVFSDAPWHFVVQEQQLGTGHALMQALPALEQAQCQRVLVVNGDTPLLAAPLLQRFMEQAGDADIAFATIELHDPAAYGRVVRRPDGSVASIVEAKDYDQTVYGAPTGEVNAGVYYIKTDIAARLLPQITCANKSGEYYITDCIALAVAAGLSVMGVPCGRDASLFGINSPEELARSEATLRSRIAHYVLDSGVIMHAPESIIIGPYATVEAGAELWGPLEIYGKSHIARGARVYSHCVLRDSVVHSGAVINNFSHLDHAVVGECALVGPYARLRIGAVLEAESHVGNFVELKKTHLGKGAKANHLSYLGDSHIGQGTNIGAGTITCNYDGKNKFVTNIGEHAFIGSNTALVAPVSVGDGALIGAGSVITHDVPEGQLGIARARQVNLPRKIK